MMTHNSRPTREDVATAGKQCSQFPPTRTAAAVAGGRRPWSVDRWGRLLAGSGVLFFTTLGLAHHPLWLFLTVAVAGSLVVTSLTDRCALRDFLIWLGAREREDLFYPGGVRRPEPWAASRACLILTREPGIEGPRRG